MFRHVAMWTFEDDDDPSQNRQDAIKIKAGLEELVYEIHGLQRLDVHIDPAGTPTGTADMMMECEFENSEAYRAFLENPRRKAMFALVEATAGEYLCMDFEEETD